MWDVKCFTHAELAKQQNEGLSFVCFTLYLLYKRLWRQKFYTLGRHISLGLASNLSCYLRSLISEKMTETVCCRTREISAQVLDSLKSIAIFFPPHQYNTLTCSSLFRFLKRQTELGLCTYLLHDEDFVCSKSPPQKEMENYLFPRRRVVPISWSAGRTRLVITEWIVRTAYLLHSLFRKALHS